MNSVLVRLLSLPVALGSFLALTPATSAEPPATEALATEAPATEAPSAQEFLQRTIAFHDPNDSWATRPIEIKAKVILSDRLAAKRGFATRRDHLIVNNAAGTFWYRTKKGDDLVEIAGAGGNFFATLTGWRNINFQVGETISRTSAGTPGFSTSIQ